MSRVLALLVLFSGGCATTYLQATAQFSSGTLQGVETLTSAFDLSSQLCRDRADIAYLAPRLKAPYQADRAFAGSPMRSTWWSDKTAGPGGTISWADYCAKIASADTVHRFALATIGAYATALASVVTQGGWSGGDFSTITTAIANITAKLGNSEAQLLVGGIAGSGGPATQIVDFLLGHIVASNLRDKITAAEGPYQTLLDDLLEYVSRAGEKQYKELNADLGDIFDLTESGLGPANAPSDTIRDILFYQFTARWELRMRYYRAALDSEKKLINAMKVAHTNLIAAGKHDRIGRPDMNEIRRMLGVVGQVVSEAAYFKNSIVPQGMR